MIVGPPTKAAAAAAAAAVDAAGVRGVCAFGSSAGLTAAPLMRGQLILRESDETTEKSGGLPSHWSSSPSSSPSRPARTATIEWMSLSIL